MKIGQRKDPPSENIFVSSLEARRNTMQNASRLSLMATRGTLLSSPSSFFMHLRKMAISSKNSEMAIM